MKRRRILAIILAAVMLLGMAPSALAEIPQHTHDYSFYEPGADPTCTEPGYHYMYCPVCMQYGIREFQKIIDPATGHNFDLVEWIKEPTCTESGQRQMFCSNRGCEAYYEETVPPLGHKWGDWIILQEPTCTEKGLRRHICQRCNVTEEGYIDPLGHNYKQSAVLREPTCAKEGQREVKCKRCGKTVTESIPKTAHTWGDWVIVKEAGPWTAGIRERKCKVCGATQQEDYYLPGTVLPGARGDDVKHLQELLNAAGYDCGKADGIAGSKTDAAIKAAEADAGVPQDGIGWTGLQDWLANGATGTANIDTTVTVVPGPDGSWQPANPVDDFMIWNDAPASIETAKAGDVIPVTIHVKNTGNTTLGSSGCSYGDNATGFIAVVGGESLGDPNAWEMKPGEEISRAYNVVVTESDVSAKAIKRGFDWAFYRHVDGQHVEGTFQERDTSFTIFIGPNALVPGNTPDERDGSALMLTGLPQEYKTFYPNDTFTVDLTATNIGEHDLRGLTIDVSKADEFMNETELGTAYSAGSGAILPVNGSDGDSYTYTIRPEDAGHIVMLIFQAKATDTATAGLVKSQPWMVEFQVEGGGGEYGVLLENTGSASQPDGALGETITVYYRAINTGSVPINAYSHQSYDADGNHVEEDGIFLEGESKNKLMPDDYETYRYIIHVRQEDVDAGIIRRYVQNVSFPWVITPAGEVLDSSIKIESNQLWYDFPLRDVPPEGDGQLKLEAGAPSQPDGALGEWIDVPLKVSNVGDVAVCANNNAMWSPETDWDLNGSYVDLVSGGTGVPWPLEPGLYINEALHVYVSQKDVDAGVIERKVYFFGQQEGTDKDVYSNTETITIPLRETPVDDCYVDLELSQGVVSPAYAKAGDTVSTQMILTNHGTAPANGCGLEHWYEDMSYTNDDTIDMTNFSWIDCNGGIDDQTYNAVVTDDDVAHGVVKRYVKEYAWRWIGGDSAAVDKTTTYATNTLLIEIPLLQDPPTVTVEGEPKLVLSMEQTTPAQATYKSGQEIEYKWTLTNIGDADCDYGGLKMYFTNKDGNIISADYDFAGLDGREVLKAFGANSKSDTGKFTLDASQILSDDTVCVRFYGRGYKPNTTEVCVTSNTVPFDYRIDELTWTPEYTPVKVTIEKWEYSHSLLPQGYVLNEDVWYGVYVRNDNDFDLYNVTVEDPLYDDGMSGHVLGGFSVMAAHAEYYWYYCHTVDSDDVARTYIENAAIITWDDPNIDLRVGMPSFPVHVTVWDENPVPPTPSDLLLYKSETSAPKVYPYYLVDDMIDYDIVVYNNSDQTLYDIYVDDPLKPGINKMIAYIPKLEPHASTTVSFSYVVTDWNCDDGSVTNIATAGYTDSEGKGHTATSNPATSPCGWPKKPDPTPKTDLTVIKVETSKPKNGSYYTEGEVIKYKIIVTNTSDHVLTDVETYDVLTDMSNAMLGSAELLHPSEARIYDKFSHVVDADDVKRGYVLNYAVSYYTDGNKYGYKESNKVVSDTNGIDEIINEDGDGFRTPIKPGDDFCQLILNGKGAGTADYTQHICAEHLVVAQQVDALVSAAADADSRVMAWKAGRALWQAKIDEMYDVLYEAALDVPTRLIVLNERMLFNGQLSVYEALLAQLYPNDEETVAEAMAKKLADKCAALCYELHTAPETRVDSYLGSHAALADASGTETCARAILARTESDTRFIESLCGSHLPVDRTILEQIKAAMTLEASQQTDALTQIWAQAMKLWLSQMDASVNDRYRAADNDGRKIVAAERTALANWLKTREELLKLLYPEDELTVNEVIAKAIMNRTVDDCIIDADVLAK